ncbi:hypothetical protein LAZ67_17001280 [Cordylochernes scorpioides]|uniref:Transposase n=1 Tax=Cordylochernes scorpioides TaxID=51811 RepID=A0ABY6LI35_9ARAC|nr:hypothetical protein LAZ67_17001280 [Cordylochernes scorpioides]
MASVFWDVKGILFIDYLEKGRTIRDEYYSNLLDQLNVKICRKRPGLTKKKKHLSPSVLAKGKLQDLRYNLLVQPPYSSDLTSIFSHTYRNLFQEMAQGCDSFKGRLVLDSQWNERPEDCIRYMILEVTPPIYWSVGSLYAIWWDQ